MIAMEKMALALSLSVALLCATLAAIFATHQWPAEIDGYEMSPVALATADVNH
jgi:hypothetical protein